MWTAEFGVEECNTIYFKKFYKTILPSSTLFKGKWVSVSHELFSRLFIYDCSTKLIKHLIDSFRIAGKKLKLKSEYAGFVNPRGYDLKQRISKYPSTTITGIVVECD